MSDLKIKEVFCTHCYSVTYRVMYEHSVDLRCKKCGEKNHLWLFQ